MDPITKFALARAGNYAIREALEKLRNVLQKNTIDFQAKRESMEIEWWGEVVVLGTETRARVTTLEEVVAALADFVKRFQDSDELMAILANYHHDAYREPIPIRRRMLAHAAAGLKNLELTPAEHARVWRVLRELDAHELMTLYRLFLVPFGTKPTLIGHRAPADATPEDLLHYVWEASGAESLASSGCVRIYPSDGHAGTGVRPQLRITKTGRIVLVALQSFVVMERTFPVDVPGHGDEGCRPEADARKMIAAFPGLTDAVLSSKGKRFSRAVTYEAQKPEDRAKANGAARLQIWLPHDRVKPLLQHAAPIRCDHGQPVDSIWVTHGGSRPTDDHADVRGHSSLLVEGPHDVLRWLAYDVHAAWV